MQGMKRGSSSFAILCPVALGSFTRDYLVVFVRDFGCVRFGLIRAHYQTVPLPFGSGLSDFEVASCSLHSLLVRDGRQVRQENARVELRTPGHVQLTATMTVTAWYVDLASKDVKGDDTGSPWSASG
jgi:hypothetical protein